MADRITSPDQLMALAEKAKADIDLRDGRKDTQVTVHMGTCGIAAGARDTMKAILETIEKDSLNGVIVSQTGCIGLCEKEPIVQVIIGDQPKVTYGKVNADVAKKILNEHVVHGEVVSDHVIQM